ncbi:carbon starvation protein A [Candidatus Epulonipiscium viviparus]|uniref:carbon starvation CstA family protein n=1 Tax=Candidatus Epulonipiscium viviparus TaxID=420336 RepID=UPI00016BFCAB|nr:carbon starvation protein A [Candidatus Epulopiscium viviparus]
MNGITMMAIAIVALGLAYILYGKWLEKTWGIDADKKTPAYEYEDGVDYVPADANVVFGHQFASIAGAGPINGPIQAAMFGWLPVLLWVIIGGIFFGAVQDFVSMYASVKNKGKTIGYLIEKYIGKLGKKMFLLFCWLFCILVIAAFADIVAATFDGFANSGAEIEANGAVASTSMIFIAEAVALGFILKKYRFSKGINTSIAVALLVAGIALGMMFPIFVEGSSWHLIIFIYIGIATITPVWALLQPRDYLNSYLLVIMILAAVVGVFVANPEINMEMFTAFNVGGLSMFPFLFVTIACGAVSGFHSLVSSGTSSKQIKNEKHMLPISYGSMLLEVLLAVIALIAVASFASGEAAANGYTTPAQIFAGAIANFLNTLGLPHNVVFTLINLAVSAFALTSLDSVARIGRISFQELFIDDTKKPNAVTTVLANKYFATLATLAMAYALAKLGYAAIWPLFGASNQLLSVIALLACAVYLKHAKKKNGMLIIPICVMMIITFSALAQNIIKLVILFGAGEGINTGNILQLIFAILIAGLGASVTYEGIKKLFKKDEDMTEDSTAIAG